MHLSAYLSPDEIHQLNQAFQTSLQHDTALVFWTGIPPKLARGWAVERNLKTLTIAMGSLYADSSQGRPSARRSDKAWSKYMKGASWLFAKQACQNRCAIVLTNAPPNVYSTREHSTYREIEEPILKGVGEGPCATQIDYVHPTVSGAARFHYEIWPRNHSSEWLDFLECITIKDIVKRFMQRTKLCASCGENPVEKVTLASSESMRSITVENVGEGSNQRTAQQKNAMEQTMLVREQQAARQRKAAKTVPRRAKLETEQRAAPGRKTAKTAAKLESEQPVARESKAAKTAAKRAKKAAKTAAKLESEQRAARERKAAKKAAKHARKAAKTAAKQAKLEKDKRAGARSKAAT
jgi:hypothetical protein